MNETLRGRPVVVLAGAGGDLGQRIARALIERGADVRALVRPEASTVEAVPPPAGPTRVGVDYDDAPSLTRACEGAACVVSALNGLEPVVIGAQGRLLDAAVPSDYSLDFTRTRPGDNRNMDLRRAFMERVDRADIRATSVLNGAFADLLTGDAPIILKGPKKVLFWGSADQTLDFTTKDDVARYVALAALDDAAPRFLRIAGDVVTPRTLATTMTELQGQRFKLWRAGGMGRLSALIAIARTLTPASDAAFPAWQGMQYMRDMSSGRGKLEPLDNDRYGPLPWTSARDVLQQAG